MTTFQMITLREFPIFKRSIHIAIALKKLYIWDLIQIGKDPLRLRTFKKQWNMKSATIEELAYILKEAKEDNKPGAIFFLGAGASKTGEIPLANEIVTDILEKHGDNPKIKQLKDDEKTYPKLMDCLTPNGRNKLLKGYIDKSKINVTHIYLAQMMIAGFVDYVLTVNFDNLMQKALALFNEFPATYDMAILKDLTTTTFKKKSVIYLHGQHHGLWLLNTKEEMGKVKETVPNIFHSIKNERPWVFVGYSGQDLIFQHIQNLGRFDNGLYWVTYHDNDPCGAVCEDLLNRNNTNASLIKGYDSDAFMLKLNTQLGLPQPKIIDKPFTSLSGMLENIVDINDEEHFKGVKERLEIAKNQVNEAIQQFEEGKTETTEAIQSNTKIELLKKEIIDLQITGDYPEEKIRKITAQVEKSDNQEIRNLLADLYNDWGNKLGDLARSRSGEEAESLYQQAFEKYKQAITTKPDYHHPFNNWGNCLGGLAKIKSGEEAELLYHQAIEKFEEAIAIKPDYHLPFNNWGNILSYLAETKSGEEAESLYHQAIEKYKQAITIKPDKHDVFNNWGTCLGILANNKSGKEAELLYQQALEKCKKSVEFNGRCYNLACVYALKGEKENALRYLKQSLEEKQIKAEFVKEDEDWRDYLEDEAFKKMIAPF